MDSFFETATPPSTRTYIPKGAQKALVAMATKKTFSFDIPPRSGKSDLIYLMAGEAMHRYGCEYCLVISPWVFLKEQICEEKKITSHIELYDVTKNIITSELDGFTNIWFWDIEDREVRPGIWSVTLPMAHSQKGNLIAAIQSTPGKVIVFFDEAHILGDGKMMAGVYDSLLAIDNVFLVTLTGTFYRRDNGIIKGANITLKETKEKDKLTMRRRIDENYVMETDYTGIKKSIYEQKADFVVPWQEAWAQGALSKINALWIDHEVDGRKISTLKQKDIAPGTLRHILESPQCVESFAEYIVDELKEAKGHSPKTANAAAMVIVGSDIADKFGEKEANRHARQVRDAIASEAKRRGISWDIEIITMTEDGNGTGAKKMKEFRNSGLYDVVIVKMMGIVGLDIDRLKVLALLSTLREGPMLAQAMTRPLTVWRDSDGLVPRIIMLADPAMRNAFKQLVAARGGMASESTMTKDEDRLVEDKKKDTTQEIGESLGVCAHQDHTLDKEDGDHLSDVRIARKKYPIGTSNRTDVEILKGVHEGCFPVTDADRLEAKKEAKEKKERPKAVNINAMLSEKCEAFNELSKEYANLIFSYALEPDNWVRIRTDITITAKRVAGITVPLQQERDLAKLKKAIEFIIDEIRKIRMERSQANG